MLFVVSYKVGSVGFQRASGFRSEVTRYIDIETRAVWNIYRNTLTNRAQGTFQPTGMALEIGAA